MNPVHLLAIIQLCFARSFVSSLFPWLMLVDFTLVTIGHPWVADSAFPIPVIPAPIIVFFWLLPGSACLIWLPFSRIPYQHPENYLCRNTIICGIKEEKTKVYLKVNVSCREHQICRSGNAYVLSLNSGATLLRKCVGHTNCRSTRYVVIHFGETGVGSLSTTAELKATTYGGWGPALCC